MQRALLLAMALASAAATPVLGQTAVPAGAADDEATVPDFSGPWRHQSLPGFEPLASGPTSLKNLSRRNGVSNYDERQIDELIDATGVTPAVNQIEWSPVLYDAAVVQAHRTRGVTLEGYSPFKSANLRERALAEIAETHGVTTRQVIVRWHIEHGIVVIPKSSDPERIAANFDVFGFALDADEIARIDELGRR